MHREGSRAELYDRIRRLRWTLAGGAAALFAALVGLVMTNPIGTQAQAADGSTSPTSDSAQPPTEGWPDDQPAQGQAQQPAAAAPPVTSAPQQQPILKTRRS